MTRYLVEFWGPYSYKVFNNYEEACEYLGTAPSERVRTASLRELRKDYDSVLIWTYSPMTGYINWFKQLLKE